MRRGTCPFQAKVENAAAASAAGVVIMNEGTSGRTDAFRGTLMRPAALVHALGALDHPNHPSP